MTAPRARRAPLALLLLAGLAALVGCGTAEPTAQAADTAGPDRDIADRVVELTVDGRERSYLLQPAQGLPDERDPAVVVVLHQEGGTPQGVAEETALAGLRERGATLVYPAGVDASWDAGDCCGLPDEQGVDDVGFLGAVLDDVATRTPVDRERQAMVGYSSGGMLTYAYVCSRPGTLAAAVVVSGSLERPCAPEISVPDVLTVHGQKDGTIGLEKSGFVAALGLAPKPVSGTLKEITASAGCRAPELEKSPAVEVFRWSGCRGGDVEAQIVAGAGHGWGGLGASERTARFLTERLLG